jgi:hypothetical protein
VDKLPLSVERSLKRKQFHRCLTIAWRVLKPIRTRMEIQLWTTRTWMFGDKWRRMKSQRLQTAEIAEGRQTQSSCRISRSSLKFRTRWALRAKPIKVVSRFSRLLRTLAICVPAIAAYAGPIRFEAKIKAEISMALTIGRIP